MSSVMSVVVGVGRGVYAGDVRAAPAVGVPGLVVVRAGADALGESAASVCRGVGGGVGDAGAVEAVVVGVGTDSVARSGPQADSRAATAAAARTGETVVCFTRAS